MKVFVHTPTKVELCTLDDSNNSHIYTTPSGEKLESVTKMLGLTKDERSKVQLKKWREGVGDSVADYIMNTSRIIGLETHSLNEDYLNMVEKSMGDFHLLAHAHHRNFLPYLDKIDNIRGIEQRLFSESMRLAGTADCIAEYDGVLSIIDYKTKRSTQKEEWMTDYFVQCTAYAEMYKELTGEKIEQLVIFVSSESNTIQEFRSTPVFHVTELNERVKKFQEMMQVV